MSCDHEQTGTQTGASPCPGTGGICWFEIPVIDIPRAVAFYRDLFGWSCSEEALPSPELNGVRNVFMFNHGNLNGAFILVEPQNLLTRSEENKDCWQVTTTFAVENVDDALIKVERAGGKIYRPKFEIGNNMGFAARFKDTEGNVHGLFSMKG